MNKYISVVLIIVGLVILIAPDYVLSKESENSIVLGLYDYHQIIGSVLLLGGGYYFYSNSNNNSVSYEYDVTTVPSSES
jgi:hypothetical protein